MHVSAIILRDDWVDKVRPIIEPYLLPASARLNNLPVLYATEVVSDGQFFSVRPDVENGKFIPLIRIPVFAVLMVFEASNESLPVGFADEEAATSVYGLGHLILGS